MNNRLIIAFGDGSGPAVMESVLRIMVKAQCETSIETVALGENVYRKEWTYGITPSSWNKISANKALLKAPIKEPPGKRNCRSLQKMLINNLDIFINIVPSYGYLSGIIPEIRDIVLITGIIGYTSAYRTSYEEIKKIETVNANSFAEILNYSLEYAYLHNRKKITIFTQDDELNFSKPFFDEIAQNLKQNTVEIEIVKLSCGVNLLVKSPEALDIVLLIDMPDEIRKFILNLITLPQIACSVYLGRQNHGIFKTDLNPEDELGKGSMCALLNATVEACIFTGNTNTAELIHDALLKTMESCFAYDAQLLYHPLKIDLFTNKIISNLGLQPRELQHQKMLCYKPFKKFFFPKNETKQKTGYDITLAQKNPGNEGKILNCVFGENIYVESIMNHGAVILPVFGLTRNMDTIVCRLRIREIIESTPDNEELKRIIEILSSYGEITNTETLYEYENITGFSG